MATIPFRLIALEQAAYRVVDALRAGTPLDPALAELRERAERIERADAAEHGPRCTCADPWQPGACRRHTVGHPHRPGCCEAPADAHRAMTGAEYEDAFPLVFTRRFVAGQDAFLVEARRSGEGVGVSLVRFFPGEGGEADGAGLGLDLPLEAVPGLIAALTDLQQAEGERRPS